MMKNRPKLKMARLSSRSVLHKCDDKNNNKKKNGREDRISGLPNEILVVILSLLTFKEAMTTSILSRRWRYLWTFITSNLNFGPGKLLYDDTFSQEAFVRDKDMYKAKFVAWVNHVLKQHQGTQVDQFRVCFELDASDSTVLDSWVKFALEKRLVRSLELNLSDFIGFGHRHPYTFPSVEKLFKPNIITHHLIALRLMDVNVTEQVVEYFLAKCPFLEQLCLVNSTTISNLKIAAGGGESLKLKYLDLYRCIPLENLEISAPNLVSFTYSGPKKEVPFKNVPLLSELCIGDEYCDSFIFEAPKHSSYLSQLEKLTLILPPTVSEAWDFPSNLPKLFNLKQLELRIGITRGYPLYCFTSLIKAAPLLSKFVLKLAFIGALPETAFPSGIWWPRSTNHELLKEIEFVGFVGHRSDYELALILLEIAVSLENITIDTRHPGHMYCPNVFFDAFAHREAEDREAAKERARQLRSHLPAGANLVIV